MNYDNWKLETPPENEKELERCDQCKEYFDASDLYSHFINLVPMQVCSECLNYFNQEKINAMQKTITQIRLDSVKENIDRMILPINTDCSFSLIDCNRNELLLMAIDLGIDFSTRSSSNLIFLCLDKYKGCEITLWE